MSENFVGMVKHKTDPMQDRDEKGRTEVDFVADIAAKRRKKAAPAPAPARKMGM